MAIIIMSHDVADYAVWKPIYDADAPRREKGGFIELGVGTQADNPKKVYMIWEADLAAVELMMADPELQDKMKEAGVVSAPEMIVLNT